jgi:hypothetical protein
VLLSSLGEKLAKVCLDMGWFLFSFSFFDTNDGLVSFIIDWTDVKYLVSSDFWRKPGLTLVQEDTRILISPG